MRLWRVLPRDPSAAATEPGGSAWFPRALQGAGRHDAPDRYGCLYAAEEPVSAIAEALAAFRGTGDLRPSMLTRAGRPLALASLTLEDRGPPPLDLDDPAVLVAEALRPSQVATRRRSVTQAYALRLHDAHPSAPGLRWWSTLDAAWANVTLFDRASARLRAGPARVLRIDDEAVAHAAELLGLR